MKKMLYTVLAITLAAGSMLLFQSTTQDAQPTPTPDIFLTSCKQTGFNPAGYVRYFLQSETENPICKGGIGGTYMGACPCDYGYVAIQGAGGDFQIVTVTVYASETPTMTQTQTRTPTSTATNTQTYTPTNTQTNTATNTATYTPTNTETLTPTDTQTLTSISTETPTLTPTLTNTSEPTNTETATASEAPIPTNTPTPPVPACGSLILIPFAFVVFWKRK